MWEFISGLGYPVFSSDLRHLPRVIVRASRLSLKERRMLLDLVTRQEDK